ncbi:MAG: DUF2178 domain-containing protein [Clostridium sp.]|nr:DUF2178 domain-containing protein [Clostridium sp.]
MVNLKKEQIAYTVMLALGIIILVAGAFLANIDEFSNWIGGISGLGGAWIGISSIKLYQIKRKPKIIEEQIIGLHDERNIAIRGNAGFMTFRITLFTLALMSLAFLILDYAIPLIVGVIILLIHIISFLILSKYYSEKI